MSSGCREEVAGLYESQFGKLTERFYKNDRWPALDKVKDKFSNTEKTPFVESLYKEMYFRHVYGRLQPTFEDRKDSWDNYTSLLQTLTAQCTAPKADLLDAVPKSWLWDILDEFVYHYQAYSLWRNKAYKGQQPADLAVLNVDIWSTVKVFQALHALVQESKVLDFFAEKRVLAAKEGNRIYLGYFAVAQLCRMHCLLGDFHSALKVVEPLDFGDRAFHLQFASCHTNLSYHMGVAYLMLQRYQDSGRMFSLALTSMTRMKTASVDLAKKTEQMTALLLVVTALCPQPIDEQVVQHIKDKHSLYEKQQRLNSGDEATFEDVFTYSCPKFVSPSMPTEAVETFQPNEPQQRQLKGFLAEVQRQSRFQDIRAYMRLYKTMSVEKLAKFLDMEEAPLLSMLLCYQSKTRQLVRGEHQAPLDGTRVNCSDLQFSIDGNMMHMEEDVPKPNLYADTFLKHIVKLQEQITTIEGRNVVV